MEGKKIVHLSDLHLRQRAEEYARSLQIIEAVGCRYAGATVLITGDLTDSALQEERVLARQLLDRLTATNPVLVVPGNHDYAWKGNICNANAWRHWVTQMGTPLGFGGGPYGHWMTVDVEPKIDGLGVLGSTHK